MQYGDIHLTGYPSNRGRQNSAVRFPDALEFTFVILVIGMAWLSVWSAGRIAITRAEESEGMVLAHPVEQRLLTYRSQHGVWPPAGTDPVTLAKSSGRHPAPGRFVAAITIETGGAFTVNYDAARMPFTAGHRLTFRPVYLAVPDQHFIYWVCGYAHGPPNSRIGGNNQTSIAPEELPLVCRGKKKQ